MKAIKKVTVIVVGLGWLGLTGCTPPGEAALLRGEKLLEKGDLPAALEQFNRATELLDGEKRAWNFLALAYHRSGSTETARQYYHRSLELDEDYFVAHFNLGNLHLENREYLEAEKRFEICANLAPEDARVGLKIGKAQLGSGQLQAAEASFRNALLLDPKMSEALNGLGLVEMQRERPEEALDWFKQASGENDDYSPAVLNQAVVAHEAKNLELAKVKYRRFLFLDPASSLTNRIDRLISAIDEELRRKEEAPEPEESGGEESTESETTVAATGESLEETPSEPQPEEPVETVEVSDPPVVVSEESGAPGETSEEPSESGANLPEETVTAPPSEPSVIEPVEPPEPSDQNPVIAENDGEEGNGAEQPTIEEPGTTDPPFPQRVLPREPGVPYAYLSPVLPASGDRIGAIEVHRQGNQSFRAGRTMEAILFFRKAVTLDATFFEGHFNLGLSALKSGYGDIAAEAYEWALAIRPDHRHARYNFALSLERGRHFTEAAAELRTVLQAHPDDLEAHFVLANLAAKKLGDADTARTHYRRVLELNPNHPQAMEIRYWLSADDLH